MRKHGFDTTSFVYGLIALVFGAAFLTDSSLRDQMNWAVPIALAAAGVGIIVNSINKHRRKAQHSEM